MLVGVLALPANPMLLTQKALRVVGPQAFGLDIPYTHPTSTPAQKKQLKISRQNEMNSSSF